MPPFRRTTIEITPFNSAYIDYQQIIYERPQRLCIHFLEYGDFSMTFGYIRTYKPYSLDNTIYNTKSNQMKVEIPFRSVHLLIYLPDRVFIDNCISFCHKQSVPCVYHEVLIHKKRYLKFLVWVIVTNIYDVFWYFRGSSLASQIRLFMATFSVSIRHV